jgi:hypothetical protein
VNSFVDSRVVAVDMSLTELALVAISLDIRDAELAMMTDWAEDDV